MQDSSTTPKPSPNHTEPDDREIERLTRIAARVRRNLLRADLEVGSGDGRRDDMLCDLAVRALAEVLVPREIIYHVGCVYVPARGVFTDHWWICVDGVMIDITAAQFGRGPVIVCRPAEFPWSTHVSSGDHRTCCEYVDSTTDLDAAAAHYGFTAKVLEDRTRKHDLCVLRRFRELMRGDPATGRPRRGGKAEKKRARQARRIARHRT